MKRPKRTGFLVLGILLISAISSMGVTTYWDGGGTVNNNFTNAPNWSNNQVPSNGYPDIVLSRFLGSAYSITEITSAATLPQLRIGQKNNTSYNNAPVFNIRSGGTLDVYGANHLGLSLPADKGASVGTILVDGGTLNCLDTFNVGNAAGSSNTNNATGTLAISNGTVNISSGMFLGTGSSTATATSTGTIVINGGTLGGTSTATMMIGNIANSVGKITVDGGTLSLTGAVFNLAQSASATGTLELLNGSAELKDLTLGSGTASIVLGGGYLTLDGNKADTFSAWAANGTITNIGTMADESAIQASYYMNRGYYSNGTNAIKWASNGTKTALWAGEIPQPMDYYVSSSNGSDTNTGTFAAPSLNSISPP